MIAVTGQRAEAANWKPSFLGKLFCNAESWSLQVQPDKLRVQVRGLERLAGPVEVLPAAVLVRSGRIWSTVVVEAADVSWELPGLPREQGRILDTDWITAAT